MLKSVVENPGGRYLGTHQFIGLYLVIGFLVMLVMEQVLEIFSERNRPKPTYYGIGMSSLRNEDIEHQEQLIAHGEHHHESPSHGGIMSHVLRKKSLTGSSRIIIIGLVFHCVADGFAFGASGYSISRRNHAWIVKGFSFSMLIFMALMLHKGPEAFSIATFLLHENYKKKLSRRLILVSTFSLIP